MRILGREAVRELPTFPRGHGFLLLSQATEVRRVASGMVTAQDLERLAALLPPSPLVKAERPHGETRSMIPLDRTAQAPGLGGETTSNVDRTQVANHIELSIQAR